MTDAVRSAGGGPWPTPCSVAAWELQIKDQALSLATRAADHHSLTGAAFIIGEHHIAMVGLTFEHPGLAGAANAFHARMRDIHVPVEQCLQNSLSWSNAEFTVAFAQHHPKAARDCGLLFGGKVFDMHIVCAPARCSCKKRLEHCRRAAAIEVSVRRGCSDDASQINDISGFVVQMNTKPRPVTKAVHQRIEKRRMSATARAGTWLGRDVLAVQVDGAVVGGERRRCEIARALASEPAFMLLDEPFAGIDPLAITDIREVITYLKTQGIGVLITDHNVRETLGIIERASIMHDGEVLFEGAPEDVLANPTCAASTWATASTEASQVSGFVLRDALFEGASG